MDKKNYFLTGMAAIALTIFTLSAAPAGADPLEGRSWLAWLGPEGYSGTSVLTFGADGNAGGDFGTRKDMVFIYTLNSGETGGTLIETSTKYDWDFIISGNTLTFSDMHPYGEFDVDQIFEEIQFVTSLTVLEDLTDTHWLGWANKLGIALLDDVVYSTKKGTLRVSNGPYTPVDDVEFEYIYDDEIGEGEGTSDYLGDFTITDSNSTMYFDNYMWLGGPPVTFQLFTYVTAPPSKKAGGR
jgi:hypothetical protein